MTKEQAEQKARELSKRFGSLSRQGLLSEVEMNVYIEKALLEAALSVKLPEVSEKEIDVLTDKHCSKAWVGNIAEKTQYDFKAGFRACLERLK